jgi:hypothetical protein
MPVKRTNEYKQKIRNLWEKTEETIDVCGSRVFCCRVLKNFLHFKNTINNLHLFQLDTQSSTLVSDFCIFFQTQISPYTSTNTSKMSAPTLTPTSSAPTSSTAGGLTSAQSQSGSTGDSSVDRAQIYTWWQQNNLFTSFRYWQCHRLFTIVFRQCPWDFIIHKKLFWFETFWLFVSLFRIVELSSPDTRETALLELSKKREVVPDLAPMIWHSFGTMPHFINFATLIWKKIIGLFCPNIPKKDKLNSIFMM